jgi:hypothetical protein
MHGSRKARSINELGRLMMLVALVSVSCCAGESSNAEQRRLLDLNTTNNSSTVTLSDPCAFIANGSAIVNMTTNMNMNMSTNMDMNTSCIGNATNTNTNTNASPSSIALDARQGALVTSDCLYDNDYPYAMDIYWSCGDEHFDEPLRLHTWKRHSRSHKRIFADQFVTHREGGLWFDAYGAPPRCIQAIGQELFVTTDECSLFELIPAATSTSTANAYRFRDATTRLCMGTGACDSDRSTGGSECGGVDHRFLPLIMVEDCDNTALVFRFESEAQDCANSQEELPEDSCF